MNNTETHTLTQRRLRRLEGVLYVTCFLWNSSGKRDTERERGGRERGRVVWGKE